MQLTMELEIHVPQYILFYISELCYKIFHADELYIHVGVLYIVK